MALKKISARQVAREYIREATLEECRELREHLNARFIEFQEQAKSVLKRGDTVTFINPRRGYYNATMVGRIDDIGRNRAKVSCPGDTTWSVPVTRLTPADGKWREEYDLRLKTYGEPTPRQRRRSKERELLDKIFGGGVS